MIGHNPQIRKSNVEGQRKTYDVVYFHDRLRVHGGSLTDNGDGTVQQKVPSQLDLFVSSFPERP